MKLPAIPVNLPRRYLFVLADALAIVLVLRVAAIVGFGGTLGLAMLTIFAVIQTAI